MIPSETIWSAFLASSGVGKTMLLRASVRGFALPAGAFLPAGTWQMSGKRLILTGGDWLSSRRGMSLIPS